MGWRVITSVYRQHRGRLYWAGVSLQRPQIIRAGLEDHFMGKLSGISRAVTAATPTTLTLTRTSTKTDDPARHRRL